MKKFLVLLFLIIGMVLTVYGFEAPNILPSQTGVVKEVEYVDLNNNDIEQVKQLAKIMLKDGEEVYVDNVLSGNPYYDINLKKGLNVILHVEDDGNEIIYSIEDLKRSHVLVLLGSIFCILLLYIGKSKGLCSLVSIILTCLLIFKVLAPLILCGMHPIIATLLICIISTIVTIFLVGGFNRKSISASLGCITSLSFAGILSFLSAKVACITGFSNENSMFLYSAHPELNFIAITISVMILAALGAVMDVGMSIASTINEIYEIDNSKSIKELFISGMNVGRDIIGTMANTLIFVYIGSSLPLIMLASNIDFQKFINLNQVVTEISSALIGSIAIVLCVPITAFITSNLVKNKAEIFDLKRIDE